jgi:NADH-quinone oxidoreductase subunit L
VNAPGTAALLGLAALLAPALAALVLAAIPWLRHRGGAAAAVAISGSTVALLAAAGVLVERSSGGDVRWTVSWLEAAGRDLARVGVLIDGVSAPMLAVVTFVALAVQVYSVAYMHGETGRSYGRYFAYHALFLFSMNLLVLAPNLLQAFAGWELVGVTSYLLIGFHFDRPSAARAAVKAFWMTKLADMGFLFALLLLYTAAGSFEWTAALQPAVAGAVTALLFIAVVGKSAQFPLHIWLPDAMEGPTPVSALLHAATMVAAGVYLVVRADPLFAQAPSTRTVMLFIGAGTAAFAALLALVQTDIKRMLAFSTCSQLGFMVAALGAGSAFAGFFHLGTHAFFKALLFLAAGSVIHAVHSNELSQMGGLRRRMPLTTVVFAIGALSLAGIPGFAGFASKDTVIGAVEGKAGGVPYLLLLGTVFVTALYMGRALLRAFFGAPCAAAAHAHEPGLAMTAPLVLLAVPSVLAGLLGGWLARSVGAQYHLHLAPTPVLAAALSLAGLGLALALFRQGRVAPLAALLERADRASLVDRTWALLYRQVLVRGADVARWVDRYLVDGLMNGIGWSTLQTGSVVRPIQTGRMRDYVFAVMVGALLLAWIGGFR